MQSNFSFLVPEFRELAKPAVKAECGLMGDARASCFYARFALETAVRWLYRHDSGLRMPYDQGLGALLHKLTFQNRVPEATLAQVAFDPALVPAAPTGTPPVERKQLVELDS